MKQNLYLGGLWKCLGKDFNNQIGPIYIYVPIYHLVYVNLHVKHGSNLIRTLNMKNMVFCLIFLALRGVLTLNPGVPRCPQMQTSSYWSHMYNKVNN